MAENIDNKKIEEALAREIIDIACSLDSVAIPGFGTFAGVKENERIEVDESTGRRRLLPPCVKFSFSPSVILRKKLKK